VPVDSFEPNAWGLYQVHGNVWEWTEDCWNYRKAGNPSDSRARTTGDYSQRLIRGGSWSNSPQALRSAFRLMRDASSRTENQGFRLARTLDP
jgi:formylglycine-generating enzyme required for sulfatase activity